MWQSRRAGSSWSRSPRARRRATGYKLGCQRCRTCRRGLSWGRCAAMSVRTAGRSRPSSTISAPAGPAFSPSQLNHAGHDLRWGCRGLAATGRWAKITYTIVYDGTNLLTYINGHPIGGIAVSGTPRSRHARVRRNPEWLFTDQRVHDARGLLGVRLLGSALTSAGARSAHGRREPCEREGHHDAGDPECSPGIWRLDHGGAARLGERQRRSHPGRRVHRGTCRRRRGCRSPCRLSLATRSPTCWRARRRPSRPSPTGSTRGSASSRSASTSA